MRAIIHLLTDDSGQDLVEYALLSGIVGVASILLFPVIAGQMGTAYSNWQEAAQDAWEPCAPAPAPCP
jgi:pilus assembly protein Flp/PilA